MQTRKQAGFTLIELIMVIALLGILAAFAIPRFADLGSDARRATVEGAAASMKSAAAIAHSAYLAAGTNPASVTLEGSAVALTNGYPSLAGIQVAAQVGTDFTIDTTTDPTKVAVQASGAVDGTKCQAVYTPATTTAPASVSVDVTDCN